MARISAVKFNGSNAYELEANEHATSWAQGVQGASKVSVGVEFYTASTGAGATLSIRSIGANGNLVGEHSQPYTIPTRNVWQRAEQTFDLPSNADKVELRIIATGGTILFAQPKLVTGNEPGPYNSNYAPQLTMLTATGIYTGTVSAQQVILTDGEGLNDRLATINSEMIQLENTVTSKTSKLTSDMLKLENTVTGKTSKLTAEGLYTAQVNADQITAGTIKSSNDSTLINLDDGTFSFADGSLLWDGIALRITGRFMSRFSAEKPTRVEMYNGQIRLVNSLGTNIGLINNHNANVLQGLNISTGEGSKYLSFGHFDGLGLAVDYYINLGENPYGHTEKHIFVGDARVRGNMLVEWALNAWDVNATMVNAEHTVSAPYVKTDVVFDSLDKERMSFIESEARIWGTLNVGTINADHTISTLYLKVNNILDPLGNQRLSFSESGVQIEGSLYAGDLNAGTFNAWYSMSAPIVKTNKLFDTLNTERVTISNNGDIYFFDNSGNFVLWVSKERNFAQLHLPSSIDNAIGVDSTGAYKITSGNKTYL